MKSDKLEKGKIGVAGKYFVAAELSRRGFVASITLRNTKGIDVLVSSEDGSQARSIQVKSSMDERKSWILNEKSEKNISQNFYYIFVNLKNENCRPDFFIVPSKFVAEYVKKDHENWLAGKSRSGKPRQDSSIRKFKDINSEFHDRWDLLNFETLEE